MNQDLGLKLLGNLLHWTDDEARGEFQWLRLMARLKYDGYRDFVAGARFLENLVAWLKQFDSLAERLDAYAFVRSTLVYISPAEMHRLVERLYPRFVQPALLNLAACRHGRKDYEALADQACMAAYHQLLRRTLFMALSDGARLDVFRHANAGRVSNEQVVGAVQVDKEKWEDLVAELRKRKGSEEALFETLYLVDDFVGTGTSFIRWDAEKEAWTGKLVRLHKSLALLSTPPLSPDCRIRVHHYLASAACIDGLRDRTEKAQAALSSFSTLPPIEHTFGMVLPANFGLLKREDAPAILMLADTYYDDRLETDHTRKSGIPHMKHGYGACALPIVLEHNTPNNALSLIWAESEDASEDEGRHTMQPLFRRKQRHS